MATAAKKAPAARKRAAVKESAAVVDQPSEPGSAGGVRYIACRPLKIGEKKFFKGDEVPEAASWTRVESWVRSGYIQQIEV